MKPLVGKGDHSVAAIASTRLPAEALSIFKQLFADGFGSTVVTSVEEGRPTARSTELAQTVGSFEAKLEALKTADAVITVGVDLSRNHQVAGFFAKRIHPNGVPLIVIDPAENGLDPICDVAIKPEAGKDADVFRALLAAAKGETIADAQLANAAQLIGKAQKPVIVYGKGLIAFNDPQALTVLIEYAKAIGASVIGVKGEANSLVAAQYQLDRPFALNGHQAAFVAIGDDYVTERLLQRLEKAPFLVAQASYASKLTAMADVVLPVTMWAEQSGHYVNLEGRVQEATFLVDARRTACARTWKHCKPWRSRWASRRKITGRKHSSSGSQQWKLRRGGVTWRNQRFHLIGWPAAPVATCRCWTSTSASCRLPNWPIFAPRRSPT